MDLRRLGEASRYPRVLGVFGGFVPAWENAVADALPARWHGWLRARSRRGFLARDLHALGIPVPSAPVHVPWIGSEAAAWGSLYVMEGSALGGQVITRALSAQGIPVEAGSAYFHGWGAATGAMWREFRRLLEDELQSPDALAQACDSACRSFDALTLLLETALHERTAAA
ncbi:MAG: putative bacteriophytochrome heme oxygenase [Ramlibacter sp.]|nr:putative bacteriophytochrome heme oxygenase [Ramlibacter sp.]